MNIDKDFARDIVMNVIEMAQLNITVMNDRGEVLASGFGCSAQKNDEQSQPMFLKERQALVDLKDRVTVKDKVTVAITVNFEGKTVCIMELTGSTEEVEKHRYWIKRTAEMTLIHSGRVKVEQEKAFIREEIAWKLLQGVMENDDSLMEKANDANIDILSPRVAIVVQLNGDDINEDGGVLKKKCLQEAITNVLEYDDLFYTGQSDITILKAVSLKNGTLEKDDLHGQVTALYEEISEVNGLSLKMGIGEYMEGIGNLPRSYRTAKDAMDTGEILYPQETVYHFDELSYYVLLNQAARKKEYNHMVVPYEIVKENDRNGELSETLKVYFEESGDLGRTADHIFIHRNTLRYRLDKIKQITGVDPKNFNDLMKLYMAMMLHRFRNERSESREAGTVFGD